MQLCATFTFCVVIHRILLCWSLQFYYKLRCVIILAVFYRNGAVFHVICVWCFQGRYSGIMAHDVPTWNVYCSCSSRWVITGFVKLLWVLWYHYESCIGILDKVSLLFKISGIGELYTICVALDCVLHRKTIFLSLLIFLSIITSTWNILLFQIE